MEEFVYDTVYLRREDFEPEPSTGQPPVLFETWDPNAKYAWDAGVAIGRTVVRRIGLRIGAALARATASALVARTPRDGQQSRAAPHRDRSQTSYPYHRHDSTSYQEGAPSSRFHPSRVPRLRLGGSGDVASLASEAGNCPPGGSRGGSLAPVEAGGRAPPKGMSRHAAKRHG